MRIRLIRVSRFWIILKRIIFQQKQNMKNLLSVLFLLLAFPLLILAQKPFNVVIISDGQAAEQTVLEQSIKAEIKALLGTSYDVNFTEIFTDGDIEKAKKEVQTIYQQQTADVLIGTGIVTSRLLANQKNYPLPTIAAINLNNQSSDNHSGISNYTFIQSPFDIKKDLETLVEISKGKKITVLVSPILETLDFDFKNYLSTLTDAALEIVALNDNPQITLNAIGENTNAVYLMSPLARYSATQTKDLLDGITAKKLPCFSLLDNPTLNYGGYATYSSSENLQKIQRRIALDIAKIAEGKNPKDFPTKIETFTKQLIINMETVNKTGVYPSWDILGRATLININKADTDRKISLKSAIAEGLENNLEYKVAKHQTEIVGKDVALAKSNYLPQLEASTMGLFLDENTVNSSFGTKGTFNWTATASASQLILSEPALANITIQKLLLDRQQSVEEQSKLDVILDVAVSYFNYRQVLALTELQNENVNVKSKNLNIAINKEKVGYSGASDVYRWETELALAKVDYNAANAQLKSVQYQLNQILNRSVKEDFIIADDDFTKNIAAIFDERFLELISNQSDFRQFADFMVLEAMKNLPEIQQIDLAIKSQERLLQSNKRAFYMPTIAAVADYNYPISVVNAGEPLSIPGVIELSPDPFPSWNAAIVVQIPIFSGGSRKHQAQKTEIGLYQLQDQQADVRNKLELQIRANMERLNMSYNNLKLSRTAADAAKKNVAIVENLYREGQVNVTTLVDAQNALLGAEINATNTTYQFMIDFFAFERSTGNYMSLETETQRSELLQRFIQFKK